MSLGGSETITLSVDQLPSHTHTYSSTTTSNGSHTHSVSGDTADEDQHTHGMSHQHSFYGSSTHSHGVLVWNDPNGYEGDVSSFIYKNVGNEAKGFGGPNGSPTWPFIYTNKTARSGRQLIQDATVIISGTTTGGRDATDKGSAHHHSISLTSGSNGAHTHTVSGTTSSIGSGKSIDIMPPYTVKYCWERIV